MLHSHAYMCTVISYPYVHTYSPNMKFLYFVAHTAQTCVAFMHGFPDTLFTWYFFLDHFDHLGYFVISLSLRGVESSSGTSCSSQQGSCDFRVDRIAEDYGERLGSVSGCASWHIVGHDWGAVIGRLMLSPALPGAIRVKTFTSSAIPELEGFPLRALFSAPIQLLSSWYFFFMQLPVAEFCFSFVVEHLLCQWTTRKSAHVEAHALHVKERVARDTGAVRSAFIEYYRQNIWGE